MITKDDFTRIDNNSNNHPRYVLHFLQLLTHEESNSDEVEKQGINRISFLYSLALNKAKKIGGKKYSNKNYGGGIAFATFSIEEKIETINKMLSN